MTEASYKVVLRNNEGRVHAYIYINYDWLEGDGE